VLRYLKAAFFSRVPVPALGALPLNVLGVVAFGALGLVDSGFWMLGAGLETLFLVGLATNARFQKVVDAQGSLTAGIDAEGKRRELVRSLPSDLQTRLVVLTGKCHRVAEIFRNQQAEDFVLEANHDALQRLEWVYLKLLVAQQNLLTTANSETEVTLRSRIAALENDLRQGSESDSLRQSRSATLAILKERVANVRRRAESLAEIESDLTRIDAQVDLMMENATIQGKPQTIATDIELATNLAGSSLFGEAESAVADLDQAYSAPHSITPGVPEKN
jgi:hypothetical protein